ncbi:hypothetical protein SDC9_120526 [bioreactor metagenome]|uniref:Uncharacterized protein n=1 Tax=bioreactor metagenome TaxID=1076179 RepID=A0A645C9R8_9ZZZZ
MPTGPMPSRAVKDSNATGSVSMQPAVNTMVRRLAGDAKRPNSAAMPPSAAKPAMCGHAERCSAMADSTTASVACAPATVALRTEGGRASVRLSRRRAGAIVCISIWLRDVGVSGLVMECEDALVYGVKRGDQRFNGVVIETGEQFVFERDKALADGLHLGAPGGCQVQKPDASVTGVGLALHQVLRHQHVDQPHKAGAINADGRRQFALRYAVAETVEVYQRCPHGIAQPGGCKPTVEQVPPAARQPDEPEADATAWRDEVLVSHSSDCIEII